MSKFDHESCEEVQSFRKSFYNRVYYWVRGADEWREALPGVFPEYKTVDGLYNEIRRAGRVARRGRKSLGAPSTPPKQWEIDEVLGA